MLNKVRDTVNKDTSTVQHRSTVSSLNGIKIFATIGYRLRHLQTLVLDELDPRFFKKVSVLGITG